MIETILKLANLIRDLSSILELSKYTPKVRIINRLTKSRNDLDELIKELKGK